MLKHNVPKRFWATFLDNVPGKSTQFAYPVGRDPLECG